MPTTLIYTHSPLPPHLTHYFSGYLGTLSLGIPQHTCNATKIAGKTTVFFFCKNILRRFSTKTFNVDQTPLPKYVVLILVNTIIDCLCLVFVNVNCNIPSVFCRLLANVNNNNGKKLNKTKQKQKTIVLDQQNKTFTLFCTIPCRLFTSTT